MEGPGSLHLTVPLLQVHNLKKTYAGRAVVNGVSFHVEKSEIVGLLGRNGAGKTTSFRMTIGMIDPDGGKVSFDGRDVSGLPMYQRARLGMGYLSQEPSVFQRLTCEQNLLAILETLPMPRARPRPALGVARAVRPRAQGQPPGARARAASDENSRSPARGDRPETHPA